MKIPAYSNGKDTWCQTVTREKAKQRGCETLGSRDCVPLRRRPQVRKSGLARNLSRCQLGGRECRDPTRGEERVGAVAAQ